MLHGITGTTIVSLLSRILRNEILMALRILAIYNTKGMFNSL